MDKLVIQDFKLVLQDIPPLNLDSPLNPVEQGLVNRVKSKQRKMFAISQSIKNLDHILKQCLPSKNECIKLISYDGGFASISFICLVAEKENILELTASTLRVGEKQFKYLADIQAKGKLQKATFFIGSLMKEDINKPKEKYDYYTKFETACTNNNWTKIVVNNHSKIILMKTESNYYVLETSSNLNENPKIEQYSFENDKELYCFYYDFFQLLKESDNNG